MKKLISILTLGILFSLISCSNLLQDTNNSSSQEIKSDDGKTYIVISKTSIRQSNGNIRAASTNLAPTKDDLKIENFSDFEISGKLNSGTEKKLAHANSYEELANKKIPVEEGSWEFKLTAKLNDIPFSATSTQNIKAGVNKISFILKSDIHTGTIDFTVSWKNTEEENQSEANKIVATLKDADETKIIAEKTLQASDITDKSARITFDKNSDGQELSSGTYYLSLDFYNEGTIKPLNTTEYYVNIADGLATRAELKVSLNETFTIQYEDNGGQLSGGSIKTLKFSQRSEKINLPQMEKPGYFWGGWYDNEELTGQPIESITPGSEQTQSNLKFYAKWNEPVLYVSGTGDDPTGDGTEAKPFESIDKACEKIIETGDSEMEWVIYIMGDVTGKNNSGKKAGQRTSSSHYARTIIPETLTSEYAKSILLTGYNGLDTDEYPQDKINRGLNGHATNGSEDGVNLVILTSVPVTINDLLIVNANNAYANPSTVDYAFTGGGILVASNATVSLGDGVVIKDNRAKVGGGVYNAGTLFVYGTALIGDRSATQAAGDYNSGACSNSTSGDGGAGIYNSGKLYLGYSDENTPAIWDTEKGGIIYNNAYWYSAGAIYNALSGEVFFNNGVLKYNSSTFTGGAIYNLGTFHMEGGSIENNQTTSGSQCNGGGVYNANINDKGFGTFIFSGGSIKSNSTSGNGGGFYNAGEVFIYGTAVIGDKNASSLASDNTACSNYAGGSGGGIYLTSTGKCYLGYSSYTNTSDNSPETWSGSISYNYAAGDGGGIYLSGNPQVFMDSGTIANNAAAGNGDALYLCGNGFVLGGTATIPAGGGEGKPKQTVYVYTNNYSLNIDNGLSHLGAGSIALLPQDNSNSSSANASSYNTYKPLIVLTDAAKAAGVTIDDIKNKFTVESFTDPTTGIVTNWEVSSEGKAQQKTENLTVSATGATGTYQSIAAAVAAMNDASKDYIITLDGEITGPQTIEGLSGEEIKANSITIKGKSSSSSNLSDIINASGGTGSALSINTRVPVTLSYIAIKGGCAVNGGGLFLGEGATAYLTKYTTIKENTNYSEGVTTDGKGGGAYISNSAKMIMDSHSTVCDNNGTFYGAGVYVENGGYLKILKGSQCYVKNNSFDERFKQSGQSVAVKGGGIYLENGATLEMQGGYVQDNTANTTGSSIGRGSGIYVSESAVFKISGSATVSLPNDVYLKGNVPVQVPDGLTLSLRARLTPGTYPSATAVEDTVLVTKAAGVSATLSGCFEITPQTLSGSEKQYWALDNDGKMVKKTGMGITVSIPNNVQNDIKVSISDIEDNPIEGDTHFTSGSTLVFKVEDSGEYEEFEWYLDGVDVDEYSSTDTSFTFDTSGYQKGVYVVYLEAKDSTGNYYSYTAQVKVE